MSRKERRKQKREQSRMMVKPMDLFRAQDAATKSALTRMTSDGFENAISRLGLHQNNALSAGTYDFDLVTRNRILLEMAYRGSWIVGQVVDSVAEDMTRAGVDVTTSEGEGDLAKFNASFSRLQIWQSLCALAKWGRLYGGAIGMMQIEGQDVSTPLDLDTVGKGQFRGIVVFDRWMLNPVMSPVIDSGPEMGLPKFYQIVNNPQAYDPESATATGQLTVHYSRCFRYTGIDLPFFQAITEMMWGESVLERLWDRLISFDNATLSSASLIDRANLRTVKIEGLREIIAAGGAALEGLQAQFEMMRLAQVNEGLTLLDKNDDFAATPYSFAGLSDMMLQFGQQLSGASGIPLVRLFGQSPAGLSATGEADIRMYYDNINAQQEAKLRNPFEVLLKVMWASEFGRPSPKDMEFTFTPLWQMDAKDKAEIAKVNTETIIEANGGGLLTTPAAMKELRQLSGETGLFSNITDEDITEAELEPAPLPDAPGMPGEEVDAGKPGENNPQPVDKPVDKSEGQKTGDAGTFKESDHPRAKNGEFGSGGSGGVGSSGSGESKEKKRKPGKLKPMEGITLHSVNHVRELSAHGEENPETCTHCGKGIKNVATINHPDEGLVKVGLDCAEALTSGEALQVVKKEIDKSKKEASRATTFGQKEAVIKAKEHLTPNWAKADPKVKEQRQARLDNAQLKANELKIDVDDLIGLAGRIAYHKDGGGQTWYEHIDTAVKELSKAAKKVTKEKSSDSASRLRAWLRFK